MPEMTINPLVPRPNETILDAIRNEASTDYRRRIQPATQAGVEETVRNLHRYRPLFNEFLDALVNRIGSVVARNMSWTNPLSEFKRGMLTYGDTIEEIQMGLLKSHIYDPDREAMERDIFGTEVPPAESNFHRVNRQEFYKITINEDLLRRAFLEENGLTSFVSQLMQAPTTSDQWDEFLLTCQLFSEYENAGGFYKVKVPDIAALTSNQDDARVALRKMRALADTLPFVSTKYNAAKMPTFAKRDEMILFTTPEFNAAIDVEALAGAFNIDRANMHGRVITIPRERFDIPGCEAILTTNDFFVIADQALENTSQFNPVTRGTNYFLHHWEIISASRFVPAVMFNTIEDSEVIVVRRYPDTLDLTGLTDGEGNTVALGGDTEPDVLRGYVYQIEYDVTLTDAGVPAGTEFSDAVTFSLTGNNSTRTYVTRTGVLHVGGDETAANLTITGTLVDSDPALAAVTDTLTVDVTGPTFPVWPA